MPDLFAPSVTERIDAAAERRVFPDAGRPPADWAWSWNATLRGRDPANGDPWPDGLAAACAHDVWPPHAFGTANASLLVLWHRPGMEKPGRSRAPWIPPETPVLGGVPHAHVERFVPDALSYDDSWVLLRRWVGAGLATMREETRWAAVMVACLNPVPGKLSVADRAANRQALQLGDRVDTICNVIQPLLVLACGLHVANAIRRTGWTPPNGAPLVFVDHPSAWEGYGSGRKEGPDVVVPLLEEWLRSGQIHRRVSPTPARGRSPTRGRRYRHVPARARPAAPPVVDPGTLVLGTGSGTLVLNRDELPDLIARGERLVAEGEARGLLAWTIQRGSKRYALLVGGAGIGRPITDAQGRDLAGIVYALLDGRGGEDLEHLKAEGDSLSLGWIAVSRRSNNPNRGFVIREGHALRCTLW